MLSQACFRSMSRKSGFRRSRRRLLRWYQLERRPNSQFQPEIHLDYLLRLLQFQSACWNKASKHCGIKKWAIWTQSLHLRCFQMEHSSWKLEKQENKLLQRMNFIHSLFIYWTHSNRRNKIQNMLAVENLSPSRSLRSLKFSQQSQPLAFHCLAARWSCLEDS